MKYFIKHLIWLPVAATICLNTSFAQTGGLFNFIRTVEVTPDTMHLTGSFARINYVPTTDRFVVTFGSKGSTQTGICKGAGYAYKEYTTDMQETGISGLLTWNANACEANDAGSTMVDTTYYFVQVPTEPGMAYGWRITKFAATNWKRLAEKYVFLEDTFESNTDPCVAFVNGQLDISDQYNPSGIWQLGTASRHHLFSPDLDSIDVRILDDSPNISGASMIYVAGIYYLISASEYTEGLVVVKYDYAWNYLGMKKLIDQANWSQGITFDGKRFYVAYLDTRLRNNPYFFPVINNVHVAAFDTAWNKVDDVAVTSFDTTDLYMAGRPWVILHNNRLYVSYDIDSLEPVTRKELLMWQARVSIYEFNPEFTAIKQNEEINKGFQLGQNYPNPCNSVTSIDFSVPSRQMMTLKVYDIRRREVSVLVNEVKPPGEYTVTFNTRELQDGVYFYQLMAGSSIQTRKCLVIR